jgi:CRISPR-associated endonuclease/helicase Cas3
MYAHSLAPPATEDQWELLNHHLERVATLAGNFAEAFGAKSWGCWAGLWHDLGKASPEFQHYLRKTADPDASEEQSRGRVDHSTFGAQFAARTLSGHVGQLLAFVIAGHHSGLPDATSEEEATRRSTLQARLKKPVPQISIVPPHDPSIQLRIPFKPLPNRVGFQVAFFTRMLFSALVDADRIATEEFCNESQAAERGQPKPTIAELKTRLDAFLSDLQRDAPTPVNRVRNDVLLQCRDAAHLPPGFFSLIVPTGGGKTYSSLAFALDHAAKHNLRRVVVAIPFTSIIEQTADSYRRALQSLAERGLVEHHSNLDPTRETRNNKLAAENWDAPLIVTTNVQLFESLFAAKTTPCRKLHRLARSVIILDEAQTISVELLQPTLMALEELVTNYGCTIVLCTATQPALEKNADFTIGIDPAAIRPIIRDAPALFTALRRVEITRLGRLSDDELADRLAAEHQSLCIVNSRPHASRLYHALCSRRGEKACYHLSTFMCAQHRREKLAEIRQRLIDRQPCVLISTALIEAGVDVDFPVVYRGPAGLDSIAQAAGRCNREGKLVDAEGRPMLGRVYVFQTEELAPSGLQRFAAQCGQELADRFPDPIIPQAIETYFRLFYWTQKQRWDKQKVLEALAASLRDRELEINFRQAASRYQIIRDEQIPILVPHGDKGREIHSRLLNSGEVDYRLLREAQPYIVGVHERLHHELKKRGLILQHPGGLDLWLLMNFSAYRSDIGLSAEDAGMDPEIWVQ